MELGKLARLAALSAVLGVIAGPAFAQGAPKADAPKAEGQGGPGPMPMTPPPAPEANWVKICNKDEKAKKEVCLTSKDVRTDTGQNVASIAIRQITGEPKRFFLAAVPPGLLIQPGIRVAVDQNQPLTGKYSICFPNACYAEVEVTDAFFKNLQKGQNLVVQAMNQQAKTLNFPVSLGGFAKAYDGPAMDPKQFEEGRKELNDGLAKKAQERRDQLQPPGSAQAPSAQPNMGEQAPVKTQ